MLLTKNVIKWYLTVCFLCWRGVGLIYSHKQKWLLGLCTLGYVNAIVCYLLNYTVSC